MRTAEKPAFSKRTLQVAERVQRLLGDVGEPVVRLFTGSSSPVYHQLRWFSTNIDPSNIATVTAQGDPEAGRLARNWDNALVMMVGNRALEYASLWQEGGRQAVGYVSEDVLHVGILPETVKFGHGIVPDTATAAMRQGRNQLQATMGLWLAEEKRMVVPAELQLVDSLVPIGDLPCYHQGTPLF